MDVKESDKFWTKTWVDAIAEQCKKRGTQIINKAQNMSEITTNATIMDFVCMCVRGKKNKREITEMINHVQIYKQVYLPFEIVRICSRKKTNCVNDNDEISPIR